MSPEEEATLANLIMPTPGPEHQEARIDEISNYETHTTMANVKVTMNNSNRIVEIAYTLRETLRASPAPRPGLAAIIMNRGRDDKAPPQEHVALLTELNSILKATDFSSKEEEKKKLCETQCHAVVQRNCIAVLANGSNNKQTAILETMAGGGIQTVMNAMQNFRERADIQLNGLAFCDNILAFNNIVAANHFVRSEGGTHFIVETMNRFQNYEDIVFFCITIIHRLNEYGFGDELFKERVALAVHPFVYEYNETETGRRAKAVVVHILSSS